MKKIFSLLNQTNEPTIYLSTIDLPNVNMTILGKRGFGKSTMAKFILQKVHNKIVIILDPMNEYAGDFYFFNYDEFQDHFLKYGLKPKKYVCKFSETLDFSILFETASKIHDLYIVIEEADIFSKPNWVDEDFFKIIRYGRHFRQNYLAICRRTAEMNNNIISQSHYCLSFRQSIPADVDKLKKFGFSENIQDLPKFHYELIEI
jgi:hypothetical protein